MENTLRLETYTFCGALTTQLWETLRPSEHDSRIKRFSKITASASIILLRIARYVELAVRFIIVGITRFFGRIIPKRNPSPIAPPTYIHKRTVSSSTELRGLSLVFEISKASSKTPEIIATFSKADLNHSTGIWGTPLHAAIFKAKKNGASLTLQIIESLVKNGADINATDERGYTPLHKAILNAKQNGPDLTLAIIDALLKHHPDINATANGNTPLNLATHRFGENSPIVHKLKML